MDREQPAREEEPRLRGPWWYPEHRSLDEEQRHQLLGQLFFEGADRGPFLTRFAALLSMSVLIAAFGLARDSGPVVIGAMLISPLTTPLLGLAASLVLGQPRRQAESFAMLLIASAGGAGLAAAVMWLTPEARAVTLDSQELLSRTEPALLDLAIAVVAGAAGAYVLIRREAIGALPGVAIAVALVPPLATVGMTLELGRSDLAGEALLLYLTNLAGIVLAASAVMLALGVGPRPEGRRLPARVRLGLAVAFGAVVLVAVPLGAHTRARVVEATDQDDALALAKGWAEGTSLEVEDVEVEEGEVTIDAFGPDRPPPVEPLAADIAAELEERVEVDLRWTRRERIVRSGEP